MNAPLMGGCCVKHGRYQEAECPKCSSKKATEEIIKMSRAMELRHCINRLETVEYRLRHGDVKKEYDADIIALEVLPKLYEIGAEIGMEDMGFERKKEETTK